MIEKPDCAVCGHNDWHTLKNRSYSRTKCIDQNQSSYERARYRVMFDIWLPGQDIITLTTLACRYCGFVCFTPRPSGQDIDNKYQALAQDTDSSAEFNRDLATDNRRSDELYRFIFREHGPIQGSIIDFGGGKGRLLHRFIFEGKSCGVIDYQETVIDGAQYLGNNVDDVKPGSAELVICSHVIEHLADPKDQLVRLSKLLTPDGSLYIEVPLEVWKSCPPKLDPVTHINFFTVHSLRYLIESAGLSASLCEYHPFIRPNGKIGMAIKALCKLRVEGAPSFQPRSALEHTLALLSPSLPTRVWRMLRHPRLLLNFIPRQ